MKHLAQIQTEFLKESGFFDDLTDKFKTKLDIMNIPRHQIEWWKSLRPSQQTRYLRKHPNSHLKLIASD